VLLSKSLDQKVLIHTKYLLIRTSHFSEKNLLIPQRIQEAFFVSIEARVNNISLFLLEDSRLDPTVDDNKAVKLAAEAGNHGNISLVTLISVLL
jgi:hypothetical protein